MDHFLVCGLDIESGLALDILAGTLYSFLLLLSMIKKYETSKLLVHTILISVF